MKQTFGTILGAVLLVLASHVCAQDATLEQAKQMMARRDAAAAYALLKPLEDRRAGEPAFDYLLGIAALDAGRGTEAVFALERVLAVEPNHPHARAEIARAYYLLGEVETSRREFEAVRAQPIPAEAAATIQKFLDAIAQIQAGTRTIVLGFVEGAIGHDSNVNSGTSATTTPAIPGFNPGVISPNAREQSDSFASLAAGVSVRHPLSARTALVAGIDGTQRLNFSKHDFDQGTINANAGIETGSGPNKYALGLQAGKLGFDYRNYRDSVGLVGQWQRQVSAAGVVSVFLQHAGLRYSGQAFRNTDRTVGGLAYAHAFGGERAPVAYATVYLGEEDERDSTRPDQGHRLTGVRFGGQINVSPTLAAFAHAAYEERDYGGSFAAAFGFPQSRLDKQTDLRLGVNYVPAKSWLVTPQVAYTDNRSNVSLTDFDRLQAFVTVRREFR
jgi:tetratricopeptide (TPR) repeat protein